MSRLPCGKSSHHDAATDQVVDFSVRDSIVDEGANDEDKVEIFVERIVYLFDEQPSNSSHFAVLLLSPLPFEDISVENTSFLTREHGEVCTPDQACNNTHTSFPLFWDLCNYMTAQSSFGTHCESVLLDQFEELIGSYMSANMPQCRTVVLYSWWFPCLDCIKRIIDTLSIYTYVEMFEVVVLYSQRGRVFSAKEVATADQQLKNAGITLRRVLYRNK